MRDSPGEMSKTAQFIEESKAQSVKEPSKKRKVHPNSLKNLVAPWPKGYAPNPGGKNRHDVAREIAQAVFSQNREHIYQAMSKALMAGNAYVFKELADRAYDKLKESKEVKHVYEEVADADLNERITQIERDLGLAREIDEAGRIGSAAAGTVKANGKAKDTPVLS
jgi:hypothetical protein